MHTCRLTCLVLLLLAALPTLGQAPDTSKQASDTTNASFSSLMIFFPTGSAEVDPGYFADLQQWAEYLVEGDHRIRLLGFTDNVGDPERNRALSARRARAVRDRLVTLGADTAAIDLAYFGEDRPVANNATAAGRRQNRRVEITSLAEAPAGDVQGDTTFYQAARADTLLSNLQLKRAFKKVNRPMPRVTMASNVTLTGKEPQVTTSNGSTVVLKYRYNSGQARPKSVLFMIGQATSFYDIPVTITERIGEIDIPVQLPTNLGQGRFEVIACLVNDEGRLSAHDTTQVLVERVGAGKLQISLSWDTDTDQDLYVEDPETEMIYYMNNRSLTGGELDRDDQNGYGPENVFWQKDAPDGHYRIYVDDYDATGAVSSFVVTINIQGSSRQFYGTTQDGERVMVVTFEKKGDQIIWENE